MYKHPVIRKQAISKKIPNYIHDDQNSSYMPYIIPRHIQADVPYRMGGGANNKMLILDLAQELEPYVPFLKKKVGGAVPFVNMTDEVSDIIQYFLKFGIQNIPGMNPSALSSNLSSLLNVGKSTLLPIVTSAWRAYYGSGMKNNQVLDRIINDIASQLVKKGGGLKGGALSPQKVAKAVLNTYDKYGQYINDFSAAAIGLGVGTLLGVNPAAMAVVGTGVRLGLAGLTGKGLEDPLLHDIASDIAMQLRPEVGVGGRMKRGGAISAKKIKDAIHEVYMKYGDEINSISSGVLADEISKLINASPESQKLIRMGLRSLLKDYTGQGLKKPRKPRVKKSVKKVVKKPVKKSLKKPVKRPIKCVKIESVEGVYEGGALYKLKRRSHRNKIPILNI